MTNIAFINFPHFYMPSSRDSLTQRIIIFKTIFCRQNRHDSLLHVSSIYGARLVAEAQEGEFCLLAIAWAALLQNRL